MASPACPSGCPHGHICPRAPDGSTSCPLGQAAESRARGNDCFKSGAALEASSAPASQPHYAQAYDLYLHSISRCAAHASPSCDPSTSTLLSPPFWLQFKSTHCPCLLELLSLSALNASAAALKLSSVPTSTVTNLTSLVLQVEPPVTVQVKALYRRALGRFALLELERALDDATAAVALGGRLEPSLHVAARSLVQRIHSTMARPAAALSDQLQLLDRATLQVDQSFLQALDVRLHATFQVDALDSGVTVALLRSALHRVVGGSHALARALGSIATRMPDAVRNACTTLTTDSDALDAPVALTRVGEEAMARLRECVAAAAASCDSAAQRLQMEESVALCATSVAYGATVARSEAMLDMLRKARRTGGATTSTTTTSASSSAAVPGGGGAAVAGVVAAMSDDDLVRVIVPVHAAVAHLFDALCADARMTLLAMDAAVEASVDAAAASVRALARVATFIPPYVDAATRTSEATSAVSYAAVHSLVFTHADVVCAAFKAATRSSRVCTPHAALLCMCVHIAFNSLPRACSNACSARALQLVHALLEPYVATLATALPVRPEPPKDASASVVAQDVDTATATYACVDDVALWDATHDTVCVCLIARACFIVHRDIGIKMCSSAGVLPAVIITAAASHNDDWVACACEVLSLLCDDEEGRSLLSTHVDRIRIRDDDAATTTVLRSRLDARTLLRRMCESSSHTRVSAATLMLAKLCGPAQAFAASKPGSTAVASAGRAAAAAAATSSEMLTSIIACVRGAVGMSPHARGTTRRDARSPSFTQLFTAAKYVVAEGDSVSDADTELRRWLGDSAPTPSARALVNGIDVRASVRAIEALAVIASHTRVKRALVCEEVLTPLCAIAASVCARLEHAHMRPSYSATHTDMAATAYGCAFIMYSITQSYTRELEAKLSDMDVDLAQWRELQKLVSPPPSASGGVPLPGGTPAPEEDPPAQVEERVRLLTQWDIVPTCAALVHAATTTHTHGRGAGVCDMVSQTMCNMAEYTWARGPMAAAGAVSLSLSLCIIPVSSGSSGTVTRIPSTAAHTLARIMITIHPSLLSHAHVSDAVSHILRLARESNHTLVQFEACLALTNLIAVAPHARAFILEHGGMAVFEYLQWSDHVMVKRAATEALTNLATDTAIAAHICGERFPLWLALARAWPAEEDAPKSAAPVFGPHAPIDAATAARMLKRVYSHGESHVEADAPTAMAALGGIAHAIMALANEGATPSGESVDAVATHMAACGAVYMCAFLLCTCADVGVAMRVCVILRELLSFRTPAAFAFTHIDPDAHAEGADATSSRPDNSMTCIALLVLLSTGRLPASMRADAPPQLRVIAARAVQRASSHALGDIVSAARACEWPRGATGHTLAELVQLPSHEFSALAREAVLKALSAAGEPEVEPPEEE